MYQADLAKKRVLQIKVLLKVVQAKNEQDEDNASELSWPEIKNLGRIIALLEAVDFLQNRVVEQSSGLPPVSMLGEHVPSRPPSRRAGTSDSLEGLAGESWRGRPTLIQLEERVEP